MKYKTVQKTLINKFLLVLVLILFDSILIHSQSDWFEQESEHFKIIYRESHAHLVPQLFHSAETALATLRELFKYTPTEKIIINTYDAYDYGYGAATSVPQNFIRLEI